MRMPAESITGAPRRGGAHHAAGAHHRRGSALQVRESAGCGSGQHRGAERHRFVFACQMQVAAGGVGVFAQQQRIVRAAAAHRGASVVEILQDCPIFNDGSFDALRKEAAEDRVINVRHGEPIVFGANGQYCVVKSGFSLEVAKTADVAVGEIVVHDAHADDSAYAFALSRLSDQNLEHTVLGIFRNISRPTYDDAARSQVVAAQSSRPFDNAALQSLLRGRDTWTVD